MTEQVKRPGEAWRVQVFENWTYEDFKRLIPRGRDREEALRQLKRIIAGGDPKKVDPGDEAIHIANLFDVDRKINSYSHLSPFKSGVTQNDVSSYFSEQNRAIWEKKRDEVKKELNLSQVTHPLMEIFDLLPVDDLDTLRGAPSFDQLAALLPAKVPDIKERRELRVLYPGSGYHIAPLLTALKLIDQNVIDRARFVYTEIKEKYFGYLVRTLRQGVQKGVFEKISIKKPVHFQPEVGSEQTLEIGYKGRLIEIVFALNRSGEKYYRESYLADADLVILHDPGTGHLYQSYDLLAEMLLQKRDKFAQKDQLVIMEGDKRVSVKERFRFPGQMKQSELSGPYGHCGGIEGVGEIHDCDYVSARVFLLNDPALQNLAQKFSDSLELSDELYDAPPIPTMTGEPP